MIRRPSNERSRRFLAATPIAAIAIGMLLTLVAPATATADSESDLDLRSRKTHWQGRYRELIVDAERLRAVVSRERELYADANRRNYRRGKKRHVHLTAVKEAKQELQEVERQLATFEDDARRAGALPGWLYEVEMEMEDAARRPAISAGPDGEEDDDGGRNPLYLEDASD